MTDQGALPARFLSTGSLFALSVLLLVGCSKVLSSAPTCDSADVSELVKKVLVENSPGFDKGKLLLGWSDANHEQGITVDESQILQAISLNLSGIRTNSQDEGIMKVSCTAYMHAAIQPEKISLTAKRVWFDLATANEADSWSDSIRKVLSRKLDLPFEDDSHQFDYTAQRTEDNQLYVSVKRSSEQ